MSIEAPGEVVVRTLGQGSNPADPPSAPQNYTKLVEEFDRRPDAWGGAFVDGDTLVVNYLGGRTDAWQTIEQLGIVEGVTLCPSTVSLTQLHEATEALSGTMTYDAGVSGYGPRYSTSSIVVDVRDESVIDLVKAQGAALDVPLEIRVDPAIPVPASRYYDTRQYYGGGALQLRESGSRTANCSMGLNFENAPDGYAYFLTAGHCYVYGSWQSPRCVPLPERRGNVPAR